MRELARYYQETRRAHPEDRLLLLFDIDGTILDIRYPMLHVLGWYDLVHGTDFFSGLEVNAIDSHEDDISHLFERAGIPKKKAGEIRLWYRKHLWSDATSMASCVPFRGVLEIIRWFQLQPGTFVGLNTGRSESMREITLKSLNRLGAEFRVSFDPDLLHMSAGSAIQNVLDAKVDAIRLFELSGYHVFAVVDNEPVVLDAVARAFRERTQRPASRGGILLLHAETIFQSGRELLPATVRTGTGYDPGQLVSAGSLPRPVEFVWCGADGSESLAHFLTTPIRWVEVDVQLHPLTREPVLRSDSYAARPPNVWEPVLRLEDALALIRDAGRAVKLSLREGDLSLREGDSLLARVVEQVDALGFDESDLWFNGPLGCLREPSICDLARLKPGAVIQVPVDFLGPLALGTPERAIEIVETLSAWGVNRMSVGWGTPNKLELIDLLDDRRVDLDICDVKGLEAFLQAVLLGPRSITSDFDFIQPGLASQGPGSKVPSHDPSGEGSGTPTAPCEPRLEMSLLAGR